MKTMFDKLTREELIGRINKLDENSLPQWGKMNSFQMLKHCTLWEEMIAGQKKYKRVFLGYVFGKLALKQVTKDETPLRRSTPSTSALIIKETSGNMPAEKKKWIGLIEGYQNFSNTNFIHPFFGKMSKEQIGIMAYKHADHHLRQFNL